MGAWVLKMRGIELVAYYETQGFELLNIFLVLCPRFDECGNAEQHIAFRRENRFEEGLRRRRYGRVSRLEDDKRDPGIYLFFVTIRAAQSD